MFRERSGNALRTLRGCSEEMHNCFVLAFSGIIPDRGPSEDAPRKFRTVFPHCLCVSTRFPCLSQFLSLTRAHTRAASDTLLYGNVYF